MAEPLRRAPLLRRMPGGWVGFHEGTAWPVADPDGVAHAPGAVWWFDGARLLAEPGGAAITPATPWHDHPVAPAAPRPAAPSLAMPGMRLTRGAAPDLAVPRAWLERLLLMPPCQPLPFAPPGVVGLALAAGGVLVLEGPPGLPLLAVLRVEGRLLGLACAGARPDADAGDGGWLPAGAWALAPRARDAVTLPAMPSTPLLFCQAGGLEFALPALEVEAVLAPLLPSPAPRDPALRGVVAHRGQVLPVLDGGLALGGAPVLAGLPVPMLRLAGPVALAVSAVEGLRRVPDTAISPAAAGGPLRATCWPAGAAIPVLDPAWLSRGASHHQATRGALRQQSLADASHHAASRT